MSNNLTESLNDSLGGKVDRLIAVVRSMDSRVETLDEKVDKRLRETQPIWESVQAQISELRELQQSLLDSHRSLVEDVGALRAEVAGLRAEVAGLRAEVAGLHAEVAGLHAEVAGLHAEDTSLRGEIASLRDITEKGFRTFDRRMERQIGEFERLHAYQRDLEDRVDKIEKLPTP